MCSEVINFIIAIRTLEKIRLKKIGLQYRPIALIRLHKPRGPKSCSFHIVSNPLREIRHTKDKLFLQSIYQEEFFFWKHQEPVTVLFGVSRSSLSLGLYRSCNVS
ncbi:unnamed protein product [Acanthoscelides obtectus]|uniref:Uncharacterized protein n=1 Tax=Acanthoscelides obtectus TaxID=200917 RepID=A0A9P0P2W6_ACAOB|nr:unnamed protein product [Acanthoscelides obtectus]CAK1647264.1 hypothetical protein AOBTE_LOCUS15140 [Acanthoscelides obtectus]